MAHASTYPGKLVLPDGREVTFGEAVDLSKDDLANAGVKEWIEGSLLIEGEKPKKSGDK